MITNRILATVLSVGLLMSNINPLDTLQDALSRARENASSIEQGDDQVTILVAGDNLIHSMIIKAGENEEAEFGYDFNYMYEEVSDYVSSFDLAILNQETPIVFNPAEYSGYPRFGTPCEVGHAAVNAGFDIFTQATNHVWDKGHAGLADSWETWNDDGVQCIGIHPFEEESAVYVHEINGMKIAMVNYTYGLNGLDPKEEWSYMVDTLYDKESIKEDLEWAEENADFTIVFPHWGIEYVHKPVADQIEWAEFFVNNGADLIVGTHPHVIEPLEYIETEDGTMVPVYYSLGNFISNQDQIPRMLGMFGEITLYKDEDGVHVKEAEATPIVTHIGCYSEYFKVYLLDDYTEELAAEHRLRRLRGSSMNVDYFWSLWNEVMGYDEEDTGVDG